jgi:hypothetical protein
MMFTARQLEALWKTEGKIVLPYRARLTPLAKDWVRAKKITLGYADLQAANAQPQAAKIGGKFVWWCDGPCGVAKAALAATARESTLEPMAILEDATRVLAAVRHLIREVKEKRAAGAILVTGNTAAAGMYANRSPLLRAIVGMGLTQVEQAVKELSANVLIVEADKHTLMQLKAMFSRFVKASRTSSETVERELKELSAT